MHSQGSQTAQSRSILPSFLCSLNPNTVFDHFLSQSLFHTPQLPFNFAKAWHSQKTGSWWSNTTRTFPEEMSHQIVIVLRSYDSRMIFLTNRQVSNASYIKSHIILQNNELWFWNSWRLRWSYMSVLWWTNSKTYCDIEVKNVVRIRNLKTIMENMYENTTVRLIVMTLLMSLLIFMIIDIR